IRWRDGNCGNAARDQVIDQLHLSSFISARGRAGVEALIFRVRVVGGPVLTAQIDLLEERIVEPLDHNSERLLFLSLSAAHAQRNHCGSSRDITNVPQLYLSSLLVASLAHHDI